MATDNFFFLIQIDLHLSIGKRRSDDFEFNFVNTIYLFNYKNLNFFL
jgi:hypothetical protein